MPSSRPTGRPAEAAHLVRQVSRPGWIQRFTPAVQRTKIPGGIMKRIIAAALAAAALAGLSGCAAAKTDQAEAAPEQTTKSASVPTNDTQRVCRAITADAEVADAKLTTLGSKFGSDDASAYAKGKSDLRDLADDFAGRLKQYPDADAKLEAAVRDLAKDYRAAAAKLAPKTADAFLLALAELRTSQQKTLGMCS